MYRRLPAAAIVLGVAGLLPFVATALGAAATNDPVQATRLLAGLVAYGAVILAFLGGPHWGFVLAEPDGVSRRVRWRLVLGVLPALVGWVALLLLVLGSEAAALAVLLAGFVGVPAAEAALRRDGLVPPGYMVLRWGLSIVVVLLLSTVLVLRVVGGRLVF